MLGATQSYWVPKWLASECVYGHSRWQELLWRGRAVVCLFSSYWVWRRGVRLLRVSSASFLLFQGPWPSFRESAVPVLMAQFFQEHRKADYQLTNSLNCSQLAPSTNNCVWNRRISPNLDPTIKAKVRYVLRTIININAFFNSWYTALNAAVENADLVVNPIIQLLDPVDQSTDIEDLLSVLMAALPFIVRIFHVFLSYSYQILSRTPRIILILEHSHSFEHRTLKANAYSDLFQ